jgi:hypothetical protein
VGWILAVIGALGVAVAASALAARRRAARHQVG